MQHLCALEQEGVPHAQRRLDGQRVGEERDEPTRGEQLRDDTVLVQLLRDARELGGDELVQDSLLRPQAEQRGRVEVLRQQQLDDGGEAPEGLLGLVDEDQ